MYLRATLIILAVLLVPSEPPALACACERDFQQRLPHEQMESYETVFAGQVIAIRAVEPYGDVRSDGSRAFTAIEVTLDTLRIWKGRVPRTVTVHTNLGGGMCGFPFAAGERYLVYANYSTQRKRLEADSCSPTCGGSEALRDMDTLDRFVDGHAPYDKYAPSVKTK